MDLTGAEKAVLMLLSLDEAAATPIIAELDPADIKRLREVAAAMRAVPTTALDEVYADFIEHTREAVAVPRGGVRYLRRLASRALGEARTDEIFIDTPRTALERVAAADVGHLAGVLENEHPQLVAAILSQLDTAKAARVLEMLPAQVRAAVLERLGSMTEVPSSLLEEVASALSAELPASGVETVQSVDGVSRSAALVRKLGREKSEELLGLLAESNAELANEIRQAMYSFEDLAALDTRALRSLLESVPVERLTLALKVTSETLRDQIFASMSKRAADRIREDMEILGAIKVAEVEAAQREIVEVALRLASEGVITLEKED